MADHDETVDRFPVFVEEDLLYESEQCETRGGHDLRHVPRMVGETTRISELAWIGVTAFDCQANHPVRLEKPGGWAHNLVKIGE